MIDPRYWSVARCVSVILVCLVAFAFSSSTIAFADDGDGSGGGGSGGGGSGSGGDSGAWRSFDSRSRGARVRCSCPGLFLLSCKCRQVAARRSRGGRAAGPVVSTHELLATGLSNTDLDRLVQRGFTISGRRQSRLLGNTIVRLGAPPRQSFRNTMRSATEAAPGAYFVRNDLYPRLSWSTVGPQGGGCGERCEAFLLTAWTPIVGACATASKIGIVDTRVDLNHPSLQDARVTVKTTRSPDRAESDPDHGTAVLSLLAGTGKSDIVGLAAGAHYLVADAFHSSGEGTAADAFDLIAGLDWLVDSNVTVINLSLSGPDNPLMKLAVSQVIRNEIAVVAASGRMSGGKSQGYPARYDGVIAVSSVDSRLRPARSATRGSHVAFVAPGVGLSVAGPRGGTQRVDGTSFAAPFVTAAFALNSRRQMSLANLMEVLAASARDLGPLGRDPVYGWGLVQYSGLPSC